MLEPAELRTLPELAVGWGMIWSLADWKVAIENALGLALPRQGEGREMNLNSQDNFPKNFS